MPEAPSAPETLQGSRPDARLPQRPDPAHPLHARRHARPRPGPVPVPAVQGHRGVAQVPQGREVHRGGRRRPDRPRQLPLQPHRAGPPPRPGRDEACAPTSAPPRCRWKTTSSRPTARPSPASTCSPEPLRAAVRATWSSTRSCSTPSARPSSAASRCSSTARPATARPSIARSIGDFMNNAGGEIYVPYAFLAENSIITVYDQAVHQLVEDDRRRPHGGQRGHHPPAAQHRHRRPALGPHPPARRSSPAAN